MFASVCETINYLYKLHVKLSVNVLLDYNSIIDARSTAV